MQIICIIGASASGKSALGLDLARDYKAEIFSLDSLSVYKYIDIASAKSSLSELAEVCHYGVNELLPSEPVSLMYMWSSLKNAIASARVKNKRALFVVGGSSFYLKSMIAGISIMPKVSASIRQEILRKIGEIDNKYEFLYRIDSVFAKGINKNDTYRITRSLEIYFFTGQIPSQYFQSAPKIYFDELLTAPIFVLEVPRDKLKERIFLRTKKMLNFGLLDEVRDLAQNFDVKLPCFKAIGIKESLEFLKNPSDEETLISLISAHTAGLAKRQSTFNRTQFTNALFADVDSIKSAVKEILR